VAKAGLVANLTSCGIAFRTYATPCSLPATTPATTPYRMLDFMNRPPVRAKPWLPADRTGGPLDDVLDRVRHNNPDLVVQRLLTTHPADDDNVYFLGDDHEPSQVQVDTAEHGEPPFVLESGIQRRETSDPAEASTIISAWLRPLDHEVPLEY
jgi:hypothetical protein